MSTNIKLFFAFIAIGLIASCYDAPKFSNVPEISFNNIEYRQKSPGGDSVDVLRITLNFRDGDGNIGVNKLGENGEIVELHDIPGKVYLTDDDIPTGQRTERFTTSTFGEKVYYEYEGQFYVLKGFKDVVPGYEWLPPYEEPYLQFYLLEPTIFNEKIPDTVYAETNTNNRNFFITFLMRNGSGEYEPIDWTTNTPPIYTPGPFDGRFPALNKADGKVPLEGELTNNLVSIVGFNNTLIGNNRIKLRVQVMDRDFQRSNIIESEDFTLEEIKIN